ncbi:MAG: winged helix-turn-helix domain-containing protein [Asticcacaulis sp.]|nr:winged helix-turn-helix domain-containing protein [Asticcacaulis sp.]
MSERRRTDPPPVPFRIGTTIVEPARNRLRIEHAEVTLEPKVMAVLCHLAAHPGAVVSRDDLIDAVWAVEYGGDESLTRAVSILRKTLTADAIETVSKRGYRLNAEVTAVPDVKAATPNRNPLAKYRWPIATRTLYRRRCGRAGAERRPGRPDFRLQPVQGDLGSLLAPAGWPWPGLYP